MRGGGLQAARDWSTRAGAALLEGWRPDLINLVRVTTAAVLAYVITRAVPVGPCQPAARACRLRSCGSRKRLRRRTAPGVTSTSSSSSI